MPAFFKLILWFFVVVVPGGLLALPWALGIATSVRRSRRLWAEDSATAQALDAGAGPQ